MTSIVVDHLQERFRESRDVGLAYIYCDFHRQAEQSAEHMLAVILRQLVQRYSVYFGIPPAMDDIYNQHKATGNSLSLGTLSQALRSLSEYFTRIYIMVDALDECQSAGGCRAKFLETLFDFQDTINVNMITTTRPIPEIIQLFWKRKNAVKLEVQANKVDLQRYLDGQLGRLPDFVRDDPVLQSKVKNKIVDAVGGMFLLATFHLESLIEEPTVGDLEIALENLPRDFFQTYDQTIERIRRQNDSAQKLAAKVLGWVVFAKGPLKCEELQDAVIIQLGKSNSDERFKPSAEKMVSVCAGLVDHNLRTQELSLVHYTVHEYLQSQAARNGWFENMRAHVAHLCMAYLESDMNKYLKGCSRKRPRVSLFGYVHNYWATHVRENESLCQDAIMNLFDNNDREQTAKFIYRFDRCGNSTSYNIITGRNPFHFAANYGFFKTTTLLLSKYDLVCINRQDSNDKTPLYYAVLHSFQAIVALLLQNGAQVNAMDILAAAQYHPQLDILNLLISSGVSIDTHRGGWLWFLAAARRCERLREIAIQLGVKINARNSQGNTPLVAMFYMSMETLKLQNAGFLSSVEILLQNGADPNIPNQDGETPLIKVLRPQGYSAGGFYLESPLIAIVRSRR
ncbi:hypothetical protein FSARC_3073 [Fusarium sarcochroum]|uniref:Ankyrin repeat protein n=1 Tax=Fusarium sarcochroum TaxID=1208366 RepID=A0A8H4U556_9HYPO|nr:hypothetical protein FSARC_3073 [Fusarium sarcochroum]